ncbi:aminotransferase class V-fold PLP-dependent enzyme [Sulfuricystis multivorans]|uniref:aminotransferase class V-fold PLP-dependent enzyme n=1 Tax=Sulfuricystis multivorans TaxID=2211108 RepID=UPI000F84C287|nr:aminotransferase class V-fold PLP-dependent enzyme [Sulfuricystis multivorans]
MPGLLPNVDPEGLLEYSVVYTDRALNHMSAKFQSAMREIARVLKAVYRAEAAIVVPGSGTFGMEAIARQFATGKKCLVIRNGWFSYRWSQIFEMGAIPASTTVLKARRIAAESHSPFVPAPIEEVVATIEAERPELVFAPHVETSSGLLLPDDYLRAVADAVHAQGGLFVLDCVASGALWVDMAELGIDILVTAPQKGWSGPPGAGLVCLGTTALERLETTTSTSFALDLKKWLQIMQAYEKGGHAYHATPPTDALVTLCNVMREAEEYGFEKLRAAQIELGARVRKVLADAGIKSVAAPGFEAPGVIVCYTDDAELQSGKKFAAQGLQIAAGVPLQCDEPADFRSFRIGLFGLDKLYAVDRTVTTFAAALDKVLGR